jgi:hypothetical protein
MSLEQIIFGEGEMFFGLFGKKKTDLERAKQQISGGEINAVEEYIKKLYQENPNLTPEQISAELIRISEANKKVDNSRRNFLKGAVALGILTALTPNAIVDLVNKATHEQVLYKSTARASDKKWYSEFPPGIQVGAQRDPMIGNAYAEYKKYHDRGRALAMLRINDHIFTKRIKRETPYVSPAYWYMLGELGKSNDAPIDFKELKKKNNGLLSFACGIYAYFQYWKGNDRFYFEGVEKCFVRSLYELAGFTKKDADNYLLNKDLNVRKKEIEKIYNALASLKGAKPYSMDPNNAWNRQLTAEWASCFLTNHYTGKKKNMYYNKIRKIINLNLEVPLRKYVPKIRGPPYY